jgi:hypothetical protein
VKERLARWRKAQQAALAIDKITELPELNETEIEKIKRRQSLRRGELD